jgi:hypothetical protein
MQCPSDEPCDWLIFFPVGDCAAEEMRQHDVEILGHVVFGEDYTVEHQMGGSDAILKTDVFDLFVEGSPEFTHMAADEDSAAERGSAEEWLDGGEADHFAFPGPCSIDGILFLISKFFLLLLFDLPPDFLDHLHRSLSNFFIFIEQARHHVRYHSAMMIVFIIQITGPYLQMSHEFLADFDVGIVDESGEVVYVVCWFVEIFDGDGVGVSEADEVLEDEGIVFPQATP